MAEVSTSLTAQWADASSINPDPNSGFLLDIDFALKDKVSDLYVSDQKAGANGRLVAAYFRAPPSEYRDVSYPHIIIDRVTFRPARSREQRCGSVQLPYTPKDFTAAPSGRHLTTHEMPIPYDFLYQITSLSRSYAHDREIQYQMMGLDRFPPRSAYLVVGTGNSATVRQMFVSDDSPREDVRMTPQEGGTAKRLFRSIWTATVSAELFQDQVALLGQVTDVALDDIQLIVPT